MRNENPCSYCREIRRKCTWKKGDPCCERCSKCGIECVPLSTKDTVISIKDDNQQLSKLWDQIIELEKALSFTKSILVPTSFNTTAMLTPRTSMSALTTAIENFTPSSLSTTTPEINRQLQWNLTVTNGQLQLDSKIKDFNELILYHQASMRYLSPLEGLLQREIIQFEGIIPGMSAVASLADLLLRGKVNKIPSQRRQITFDKHILPPPCSMTTYRDVIDYLVKMYMKHCNTSIGMLHEPSFMDYYQKLKDPLKSPIVLATCIDGIAYLYPQLAYTSLEKRQWGEFFYNRCRDLLFELYDDRNRRLEVVITTSLLAQYMQSMVMYCSEARRLITLALLTCTDLIEEQKNTDNNKTMSYVERILLERHYMHLQFSDHLLDVYLEGKVDFSGIKSCSLELLEGEKDEIICYLEAWKSIFTLIGSPYMVALMEKISHTVYGEPCEINLDMIMEFEPMVREWWASLPEKFQICSDPFATTTLTTIQQTLNKVTTPTMMVPFAALHCLSSIIQSSMLNPSTLENLENDNLTVNNNNSMLRIIREKASSLTLTSIKMLAYVMKQNLKMNTKVIPLSPGYMMGALHAVCSIVNRNMNTQFPFEVLQILSECFNQINLSLYENHQFTASSSSPSPLELFMAAHNNVDVMDDDVYNTFPFPGYAMTSDVFYTCFHQLEQKFRVVF